MNLLISILFAFAAIGLAVLVKRRAAPTWPQAICIRTSHRK